MSNINNKPTAMAEDLENGLLISQLPKLPAQAPGVKLFEVEHEGQSYQATAEDIALQGKDGKDGVNGLGAFEEWSQRPENKDKTYDDWMAANRGEDGKDAPTPFEEWESKPENKGKGWDDWMAANKGEPGLNPLEFWLSKPENAGKTEADYNEAFKGKDGGDGENGAKGEDAEPPRFFGPIDALPSAEGVPTNHIYFIREDGVTNTYTAFEGEWFNHGDFSGPAGLDAYQLAVENGFIGDYEAWELANRGKDGIGLRILGSFTDIKFLPTEGMVSGDAYIIDEKMWVWDTEKWSPVGQVGPVGPGFMEDWLKRNPGKTQEDFEKAFQGKEGKQGPEGKDALAVAKANDPEVTDYESWTLKLTGPAGKDAVFIKIIDVLDSTDDLPETGEISTGYVIADEIHAWTESGAWKVLGKIQGPEGPEGPEGLNPFLFWKKQPGNEDKTLEDYNAFYTGPTGPGYFETWKAIPGNEDKTEADMVAEHTGKDGADGENGKDGKDGVAWEPDVVVASVDDVTDPTEGLRARVGDNAFVYREGAWVDLGLWVKAGPAGKDALEDWLARNPNKTEDDYREFFQGKEGRPGEEGKEGPAGTSFMPDEIVESLDDVVDPAEGYSVRVGDEGFRFIDGTWKPFGNLAVPGKQGEEGPVGPGFMADWLANNPGKTQEDFEATFRGKDGNNGENGKDAQSWIPKGEFDALEDVVDPQPYWYVTVGGFGYIYFDGQWVNQGRTKGDDGDQGNIGPDGKSYFEVVKEAKPEVKDIDDLIELNRGTPGKDGDDGLNGNDGDDFITAWMKRNPDATDEDFEAAFQGKEGPEGPMSPSLRYKDFLNSTDDLPTEGVEVGDAYIIDGHFWAWSPSQDKFLDGGVIQGVEGKQGPEGKQGERGQEGKDALTVVKENDAEVTNYAQWQAKLKGERGQRGNYWFVENRDPTAIDGEVNDFFLNKGSLEYFRKTSPVLWAPLGHLGGGNVHDATHDNTRRVRFNDTWVALPFDLISAEGNFIGTKDGWKRLDVYDLATRVVANGDTLNLSECQVYHVNAGSAISFTIPNYTAEQGRTMTVVLIAHGTGALFDIKGRVNWGDAGLPTFGADYTVLTLVWDDVGLQWLGSGGSSGKNLA